MAEGSCCYSTDEPIVDLEQIAFEVAPAHVVPVVTVEGGSHADDPAVPSEQPFGGVIAAGGSVVGTEDAAGVPVLDPGGEAWRDGGDGDHGTFPALGRHEMEGEGRQGVDGALCDECRVSRK